MNLLDFRHARLLRETCRRVRDAVDANLTRLRLPNSSEQCMTSLMPLLRRLKSLTTLEFPTTPDVGDADWPRRGAASLPQVIR